MSIENTDSESIGCKTKIQIEPTSPSNFGDGLLTQSPLPTVASTVASENENISNDPCQPSWQNLSVNPSLENIRIHFSSSDTIDVQARGDAFAGENAIAWGPRIPKGSTNETVLDHSPSNHADCLIQDGPDDAPVSEHLSSFLQPLTQAQDTLENDSGDDCHSILTTSSSEDELLDERRRRRVAQNQTRLEQLGLHNMKRQKKRLTKKPTDNSKYEDVGGCKGCIFVPNLAQTESGSENLILKYPGREREIRLLKSVVNATTAQVDREPLFVSPPIFVTGPGGTCKTSIIRSIVMSSCSKRIAGAYVNCATLEPSSIEALVESAYQQIANSFHNAKSASTSPPDVSRSDLNPLQPAFPLTFDSECAEIIHGDLEDRIEQARSQVGLPEQSLVPERSLSRDEHLDVLDPIMHESKKTAYAKSMTSTATGSADDNVDATHPIRDSRNGSTGQIVARESLDRHRQTDNKRRNNLLHEGRSFSTPSSHGAPLALARALRPLIGEHGTGAAFLILDCAERLMNSYGNQTSTTSKTNYLSQLLLLPKVMQLKLTLIVVSRSSLLLNSRIDNSVPVEKSIASIKMAVQPICIHFPAYSDIEIFEKILMTPDNLSSFIGLVPDTRFHRNLVRTFVQSLVRSTRPITRDVRDIMRVGRRLWLSFIEPLSAQNIQETMKAAGALSADDEKAMLSYLGTRMMKLAKNVENMLFSFSDDGVVSDTFAHLPYLCKCMILASFICQHNKATKDRQLFAITSVSKRRRQNRPGDLDDAESIAFATLNHKGFEILRPRPFPLERMLTIFISIVGLHDQSNLTPLIEITGSLVLSLGNTIVLQTIGQLREMGVLMESPNRDGEKSLSTPMYFCGLGRSDAESVARSIDLPLESYLL